MYVKHAAPLRLLQPRAVEVRIRNELFDSREPLEKPDEQRASQHAECSARRRPHELLVGEEAILPLRALVHVCAPARRERVAFAMRWKLRGERAHQLGGENARAVEHDVRERQRGSVRVCELTCHIVEPRGRRRGAE